MPAETTIAAAELRARVQQTLTDFMAGQIEIMAEISPELTPLAESISWLVSGGKRLRPAFFVWAYLGSGGTDLDAAVSGASALEMVQACALIHDDVMDASDTRRGMPATHRRFAGIHQEQSWSGSSDRFGAGAAILAGDLCLSWADELLARSGFDLPALARAKPWYDRMRTELMCGQFLDLLEQARGGGSAARALRVVRFKTAKYTIERPLHIGAALAGASPELLSGFSRYGLPLGEAFQLRDDLLGVFGDPERTGKPAGDDLREGKATLLVAVAMERADEAQLEVLRAGLGDPTLSPRGVAEICEIILATGAAAEVESVIERRTQEAAQALEALPITEQARAALAELAVAATARNL